MRKRIAFKPHETRGQEIIKILENMGGVNKYNLDGSKGIIAIETNRCNYITNDWDYWVCYRVIMDGKFTPLKNLKINLVI